MNHHKLCAFALVLLSLALTIPQNITAADDVFENFSVRQGLSNRQVYEVCQDSAGFIWIYTNSGIDRFDGSQFRHYRLPLEESSRDFIQSGTSVVRDQSGNVWIALKTGQIFAYDRRSDSFVQRLDIRGTTGGVILYDIAVVDNGRGHVVATSEGLWFFDDKGGRCIAAADEPVFALEATPMGYYIGTGDGVALYNPTDSTLNYLWQKAGTHVTDIRAEDGRVVFGTFADGAYIYDYADGGVRMLGPEQPRLPINDIEIDNSGEILIGIDGVGVVRFDAAGLNVLGRYSMDEEMHGSLSSNTITDIEIDNAGGLWIATSTAGVNYKSGKEPATKVTKHVPYLSQSLASDNVNAIFQDSRGNTWYATDDGVSVQTPGGVWRHFLKGKDYSTNVFLAIEEDADGKIWVGGYGTGTFVIDPATWAVRALPTRHGDTGIGTGHVFDITAVGDEVWLGGIEGPITRYNIRTGKYTYFPHFCVGGIAEGEKGEVYIAGCAGLGVIRPGDTDVTWISDSSDFSFVYPVSSVVYDRKRGEVWMPTDGQGLVRYDVEKGKFSTFMPRTELESASINALVIDQDGSMWFCTETTMYHSDDMRSTYRNINPALGIEAGTGTFNARAGAVTSAGLSFGTAEGAITFRPDLELEDVEHSKIVFNDLSVQYELQRPGSDNSLLPDNLNDVEGLVFPHDKNAFELSFSTVNFTSPRRMRYEYMLEGYDKDWISADNGAHTVSYSDLPPGRYVFRVLVQDAFSHKTIDERSLPIVIKSPWWSRWWSILLFIVLGVALVVGLARIIIHRRREKQVNEKIQAFINVAHDIRTPVTLIKAPLTEIQQHDDLPEKVKRNSEVAMTNLNRLLDMIGQLVDINRESNHSDDLSLEPCNIRRFVNEKVETFRCVGMHKGLLLKVKAPHDFPEMEVDVKKLDHILDNLISNAIKYTDAGEITVSLALEKKFWTLSVSDTGMGIPKKDQKRIFRSQYRAARAAASTELGSGIGLLITKRLVKLHRGDITFESEEGKGTKFVVRLPRLEAPDGSYVAPVHETAVEAAENPGKPLIYLAEDDPDIRRYMCSSLGDDFEVVAVDNGEAILEMVTKNNPDLILSDVMMPGLGGIDLCRQLKSNVETSHIPVILLTGLTGRNDIIAGLEAGANDYIAKPFDMSVLRVRIKNILDNRNRLRQQLTTDSEAPAEDEFASELDRAFIDRVRAIIDEHMADSDYSIADVCRELGMSRTSVYNKIKSLTGLSINDYIRVYRLNKAKELLLKHQYNVAEVAYMVGFADAKYFSTCFKKQFDISPSKV